jgi:hypothetical protein
LTRNGFRFLTGRSRRGRAHPSPLAWHERLKLERLEHRWVPATITPTTFADGGLGSGSLRDAVLQFNADTCTDDDIIQLLPGTYRLTIRNAGGHHETAGLTGDLNLTQPSHRWIIQGTGPSTIISASQLQDRVFQIVNPGTQVVFQDLVIQAGLAQENGADGAVAGTTDALGGGIFNNGSAVALDNVILQNNEARGGDGFRFNQAGYNAQGGGLYSTGGALTISHSVLANNRAIGGMGGLSTIYGDFQSPGGDAQGGGLYASGGLLTFANSTSVANTVHAGDGGIFGIGQGGTAQGDGLYIGGGTLNVSNSTIATNNLLGGHGSQNGTSAGAGQGAGLWVAAGTAAQVSFSSIATNQATGGSHGAGGMDGAATGGGLFNQGTLRTDDTILADNTVTGPGSNTSPDLFGNLGSLGYNLIGNSQGGSGYDRSDLLDIDPLLGPLQDNSGPTETIALLASSPALNAGDPNQLGTVDQRGVMRTRGVNIGAYQASATTFLLTAPDTVSSGVPFDVTVKAVDPFGQAAVGYLGTVTFSTSDPDPDVVLPADYAFQPSDGGQVAFPGGVTLITPGDQTLTVTDTANNTLTGSAVVTVSGAAPGTGGHGLGAPPSRSEATSAPAQPPPPGEPSGAEVLALDRWLASSPKWNDGWVPVPVLKHHVGGEPDAWLVDLFGKEEPRGAVW